MSRVGRYVAAASLGFAFLAGGSLYAQDTPGATPSAVKVSGQGETIYREVCQACHMADARGGGSAGAQIPALAKNFRLADSQYGIRMLLQGRGGMPAFGDMLTADQVAAVLTYVRSHFNAFPDPVTEADVKRVAAGQ